EHRPVRLRHPGLRQHLRARLRVRPVHGPPALVRHQTGGQPVTRLDGKVAIITGGAGGHGRATTARFVDAGATVYPTHLPAAPAQARGSAGADARGAAFLRHDVTTVDSGREVVDRIVADTGRIDVLINNAAIIEWRTMTETTPDVWDRVVAVNQTGPLLGMQA